MKQVERILGMSAPTMVVVYSLYHHIWKVLNDEQERISSLAFAIKNFGRICLHKVTKEEIEVLPRGDVKVEIKESEMDVFLDLLAELKKFGDLEASANVLYRTLLSKTDDEKLTFLLMIFSPMFLPFEIKEDYASPPKLDEDSLELHAVHHEVILADTLTISYDQFDYLIALMMKRYAHDINKAMFMIRQVREQAQSQGAAQLLNKLRKELIEGVGGELSKRLEQLDTTNLFSRQKPAKDERPN